MDFPDAIRYVAHKSGIVIEEVQRRADAQDPRQPLWDVNAMVADWFRTQLWDERAGEEARNYLAFRRISRDVADRFGLGFAPRDADAMRIAPHRARRQRGDAHCGGTARDARGQSASCARASETG